VLRWLHTASKNNKPRPPWYRLVGWFLSEGLLCEFSFTLLKPDVDASLCSGLVHFKCG